MTDYDYHLDETELSVTDDDDTLGDNIEATTIAAADVSTDTLQLFLKDVGKYHVLNKEEEVALATIYVAGDTERPSCCRLCRSAKDALVNHNLRMVISVANRYHHARGVQGISYLDLIQEGMFGLIRAVEKFDHTKGHKFSTYAMWWIRQSITRAIAEKSRTIRVPIHVIEKLNKINRATEELQVEHGREPTMKELADKLGMTEDKVTDVILHTQVPISLDRPVFDNEDESSEVGANLTDVTVESPHDLVAANISSDILGGALTQLTWREQKILSFIYGLGGEEKMSKADIGKYFAVTYQRISQIEREILEKLSTNPDLQILREF